MTPAETTAILRQFNEWRRGADVPQPKPREIGEEIDAAIAMIERTHELEIALREFAWSEDSESRADFARSVLEESK